MVSYMCHHVRHVVSFPMVQVLPLYDLWFMSYVRFYIVTSFAYCRQLFSYDVICHSSSYVSWCIIRVSDLLYLLPFLVAMESIFCHPYLLCHFLSILVFLLLTHIVVSLMSLHFHQKCIVKLSLGWAYIYSPPEVELRP